MVRSTLAAIALACAVASGGCHLILGYESSYEEGSTEDGQATSAAGSCLCDPGQQQPCGNCGVQTCTDTCVWGACENQGVCVPGTEEPCGNGCGVRVCSYTCTWCGCPSESCADCDGIQGGWPGCRGNGCSVCIEKLADFPCYFQNHPGCAPNVVCKGEYFACSAKCPSPTPLDACMCPPIGDTGFWSGCEGSGCQVCPEAVADYACYFINHPLCVGPESCEGSKSSCSSDLCPPPTDADKGSVQ